MVNFPSLPLTVSVLHYVMVDEFPPRTLITPLPADPHRNLLNVRFLPDAAVLLR